MLLNLLSCRVTPPENPDINSVKWAKYSNPKLSCSLEYPDGYTIQEDHDKNGVLFRYDGSPVLLLRYTDEHEGRNHGLWFGHEAVEDIKLGEKSGQKYVYDHYDGPVYSRTVSYVIEYRDRFLGLEFRIDKKELDDVQRHILESFAVTELN